MPRTISRPHRTVSRSTQWSTVCARTAWNGHEIVGCYHSHPNGRPEPSKRDLEYATEDGFIWLIAALDAGAVSLRAPVSRQAGFDEFRFAGIATLMRPATFLLPSLAVAAFAFGLPWLTHFADRGLSLLFHLAWFGLLVAALIRTGWRGLWLLLGAPLVLFWPVVLLVFVLSDDVHFGF